MRATDRACRAEAERRQMSALIHNAHGVAEWRLFLNDKAEP